MYVDFKIAKPDEMIATISITMKVKDFRELKRQLKAEWPSWKIGDAIQAVIRKAETAFYEYEEGAKDS
ncbi:MAG: hypothetical protein KIT15_17040 [Xanthobacteraceae bacterium]|nr:hypothetical protein [Xanthobacteraceae bacterium]